MLLQSSLITGIYFTAVTGNRSSHLGFEPTTLCMCCAVKSTDYGVGLDDAHTGQWVLGEEQSKLHNGSKTNTHSLTNGQGSVIWLCFWEECCVLAMGVSVLLHGLQSLKGCGELWSVG